MSMLMYISNRQIPKAPNYSLYTILALTLFTQNK